MTIPKVKVDFCLPKVRLTKNRSRRNEIDYKT